MELYYTPAENIKGKSFVITGSEVFHIHNVMRKKVGDEIFFTDGKGWQYQGKILTSDRSFIKGEIIDSTFEPRESRIKLTLAFGLLKGNHNDLIVEKGTEIGVSALQTFFSQNSIVRTLSASKMLRLQRIVMAAAKQSLRTVIPEIQKPVSITELTSAVKNHDHAFIAYEAEPKRMRLSEKLGPKILLVIGPEGGFTAEEIATFLRAGGRSISLGKTRLRSETAAIVACGLILGALP